MIKEMLRKILNKERYNVVRVSNSSYPPDIQGDKEFIEIYEKCKPYTMYTMVPMKEKSYILYKAYAVYKAVEYISKNKIPGDLVECGVWKGGQSMLMAYTLLKEKDSTRRIWLYDTYKGMSKPNALDVRLGLKISTVKKWLACQKEDYNEWCFAPIREVKKNMFSSGYPKKKIKFIEGRVEETVPSTVPEKIALLRLDTDWYKSTYHELKHLYPLLVKRGVLIVDDYGYWEGSRKATNKYFSESTDQIFLVRCDPYGGVIGVKF